MNASSIHFLGDVYLPRAYSCALRFPGEIVLNLEYAVTRSAIGIPGKINLKAPQLHTASTFGKSPLAVSLANNHSFDFGDQGIQDTLRALSSQNVRHFGCGTQNAARGNPLIVEIDGTLVALVGYARPYTSPVWPSKGELGPALTDPRDSIGLIAALVRTDVQRVIVAVHWGAEEVYLPTTKDIEFGRALVDAGADLVIGHHAHRIQPYEVYNGKHIFYGLGNCIMPDLSVQSYFDADGRPSATYTKHQLSWNRRSLCVTYSPRTGNVTTAALVFDGNTLSPLGASAGVHSATFNLEGHDARFRRALRWGMLRVAIMRYCRAPRLPRRQHLQALIAILTRDTPR